MVPAEYRESGFTDYLAPGANWAVARRSLQEDEFCLDPTRMTLVCGTAGFDGTQFKGILANRYNIQLNKTSRNSVLLQSNINNTRSDVAHLIRVLVEISGEIDQRLSQGGANVRQDVRRAGEEPDDGRAGPAELLAFPRRLPGDAGEQDQRRRHPQRLLCRLRRGGLRIHPPCAIPRSTAA